MRRVFRGSRASYMAELDLQKTGSVEARSMAPRIRHVFFIPVLSLCVSYEVRISTLSFLSPHSCEYIVIREHMVIKTISTERSRHFPRHHTQ